MAGTPVKRARRIAEDRARRLAGTGIGDLNAQIEAYKKSGKKPPSAEDLLTAGWLILNSLRRVEPTFLGSYATLLKTCIQARAQLIAEVGKPQVIHHIVKHDPEIPPDVPPLPKLPTADGSENT